MTLFLGLAEAAQLGLVVAQRDEHGQCALDEGGRMADHQAAQGAQLLDQLGRSHDIAHAKAGCQALGEAADIDHAVVAVQAFECRDGLFVEAAFAFVVVLDDDEIVLLCGLEQGFAPLQRHGDTRGALMAGRDVEVLELAHGIDDRQSIAIHANGDDLRGAAAEDIARIGVAGVFDADGGALAHQQIGHHVQRMLGADRDDDFVG